MRDWATDHSPVDEARTLSFQGLWPGTIPPQRSTRHPVDLRQINAANRHLSDKIGWSNAGLAFGYGQNEHGVECADRAEASRRGNEGTLPTS